MNKSAREMFEELGLDYRKELYRNDELDEIQFSNGDDWIIISKERIRYVENHNVCDLPLKFLKPINKLLQELGWLDE